MKTFSLKRKDYNLYVSNWKSSYDVNDWPSSHQRLLRFPHKNDISFVFTCSCL